MGLKEFLQERFAGYKPQTQVLSAAQLTMGRSVFWVKRQDSVRQQVLAEQERLIASIEALVEVEKFDGLVTSALLGSPDGDILEKPRGSQFVRQPLFKPAYVLDKLPPPTDKFKLRPFERELFTQVREAGEYLRLPNRQGIWNFFATLYLANMVGQSASTPVNVWMKFRPDIGWAVRQNLIGDGLELVSKEIRYGAGPERSNARRQLDVVDIGTALFGIELGGTAPGRGVGREGLLAVTKLYRNHCRQSAELAEANGHDQLAAEIKAAYSSWTTAYGMPLPLHTLRLGTGKIAWK